eukprot:1189967-Prorocentrum_minimum.AAC.2
MDKLMSCHTQRTRSGHQSQKGRENIPAAGTNRRRGERIYPQRAPIAQREREDVPPRRVR